MTTAPLSEQNIRPSKPPLEEVLPKRASAQAPQMLAERYEVINTLVGGMGLVYLCRDHLTGQLVALKTFKPEYLANRAARDLFLREGTMWVEMGNHPHIVQAYRVERIGDGREVYLVLEWIVQPKGKGNPSLRSWLKPGEPLPVDQSLLFALHVTRGMKYAVQKIPGLVHRDIKPENILIGYDGGARVTDFGLASTLSQLGPGSINPLENKRENLGRTQLTQGVAGTPLYMAPEQWQHVSLDVRADIYALGCILYEMVNGRFAAAAENREELKAIHLAGNIAPPNPDIPRPVMKFLRKCLMPKREQRYRNWSEVETALIETYTLVTGKPAPPEKQPDEITTAERLAAGHSYNTMGLSYLDIGKLDVAILYFEQAVNIARMAEDLPLEGAGLGNLGLVYTALGYNDRAIEFHDEHLGIANQLGDRAEQGRALGNLGRAYRQKGEPERAITFHNRELTIAQSLSDRMKEAAALHSLGETYRQLNDREEAVKYYRQSLAIARDIGDRTRVERIMNSMGEFYLEAGETKEAIALFKKTLTIAREIGDRVGEGVALANTAELYFSIHKIEQAIEYAQHALTISAESTNLRNQVKILLRLGDFQLAAGQLDEAGSCFEQALQGALEIKDPVSEQKAYAQLGRIFLKTGDVTNGGKMLRRALTLAQEQGDPAILRQGYLDISRAYEAWGDIGGAIKYLQNSLEMAGKKTDLADQAWHWGEIGRLYFRLNQHKQSLEAYQQRLQLARELQNRPVEAETMLRIGDVVQQMDEAAQAIDFYKKGQMLAEEDGNWKLAAAALGNLGLLYQKAGKKRTAVRAAEKAVELAKKSKSSRTVANASVFCARVLIDQGKWEKAHPHASMAYHLYDRLGDERRKSMTEELLRSILDNKGKNTGFFNLLIGDF